ncbi:unnamed protein product [Caretta caretta]
MFLWRGCSVREKQGRYSALQPNRKACLELPAVRSRRDAEDWVATYSQLTSEAGEYPWYRLERRMLVGWQ